jgi:hypothetical protein
MKQPLDARLEAILAGVVIVVFLYAVVYAWVRMG